MKVYLLFVLLFLFVACGNNASEQKSAESIIETTIEDDNVEMERTSVEIKVLGDRVH